MLVFLEEGTGSSDVVPVVMTAQVSYAVHGKISHKLVQKYGDHCIKNGVLVCAIHIFMGDLPGLFREDVLFVVECVNVAEGTQASMYTWNQDYLRERAELLKATLRKDFIREKQACGFFFLLPWATWDTN